MSLLMHWTTSRCGRGHDAGRSWLWRRRRFGRQRRFQSGCGKRIDRLIDEHFGRSPERGHSIRRL
ncbi:MAG: hypothetical protein WAX12_13540 [Candidatus Microthrix subdominans]